MRFCGSWTCWCRPSSLSCCSLLDLVSHGWNFKSKQPNKKKQRKKKGEKYWLEQNQNKLTKPTLLLEKIFFKFYVIGLLVFFKVKHSLICSYCFFPSRFWILLLIETVLHTHYNTLPWNKLVVWSFWSVLRMYHKQHVRETCPKVCSICVMMSRWFWCVNIHAFWTVKFDHCLPRNIRQTYGWQKKVSFAKNALTTW